MDALKSDYFQAVCLLVREDQDCEYFGIPDIGLSAALCTSLRWYMNGPMYHQLLRKTLMKEVLDARRQ